MKLEELIRKFDGADGTLILVIGYPDRTEMIRCSDDERWEKLCDALTKGGRGVGLITLLSGFATQVRVLEPYPEREVRPYLEKLAQGIVAGARLEAAIAN
jgi:hypothetical protein